MNLSVMRDGSERIRYQDPAFPVYICVGDLRSFPGMKAMCHWHEDVELIMPICGKMSYHINGKLVCVGEGDALYVAPRQVHYGFSADGTDCEYLCLCFRPELLAAHPYLYDRYVIPMVTDPQLPYLLFKKDVPEDGPLLEVLQSFVQEREHNMNLMGRLYVLWQAIFDNAGSKMKADVMSPKSTENLKRMVLFIKNNYTEALSLAQIAAAGEVSRSRCCQLFRECMGITPNEYVINYRLEHAMALLRESGISMTEIANICGFNSSSYFAEVFSRYKGCTPTAYRKKYNQKILD